jgi:hypothetical protein
MKPGFVHGHQSQQEIVWIAQNEKIPKVPQMIGTVHVFDPRSGISGPTLRRVSACPKLNE